MGLKTTIVKYDIPTISEEAKKRKLTNPNTINGTLGTFYYDDEKFKAYETVKKVMNSLEDVDYYSYSPTSGGALFEESVIKWVFKSSVSKVKETTNIRAVAVAGGTGSLLLSMLEIMEPGEGILIADLCWAPYITMCEVNNFEAVRYSMFNDELKFNLVEFKQKCLEMLTYQDSVNVLINDPCNNPTGYSLTMEEFNEIMKFFDSLNRPVNILYDTAYADYCSDQQEVLDKLEMLANLNNKITTFICFSASKTFCSYGVRLGSQLIMSKNSEIVDTLYKRSCILCRTHWSNVSKAGINMMVRLVNNPVFKEEFLKEQIINKTILLTRIKTFLKEASDINLKVYNSKGGFFLSVPCNNPPMVFEKLKERKIYVIPLQTSIRIAICSVSIRETVGLAGKIKEVIAEVNQ